MVTDGTAVLLVQIKQRTRVLDRHDVGCISHCLDLPLRLQSPTRLRTTTPDLHFIVDTCSRINVLIQQETRMDINNVVSSLWNTSTKASASCELDCFFALLGQATILGRELLVIGAIA